MDDSTYPVLMKEFMEALPGRLEGGSTTCDHEGCEEQLNPLQINIFVMPKSQGYQPLILCRRHCYEYYLKFHKKFQN